MKAKKAESLTWEKASSLDEAKRLIDQGILLQPETAQKIRRRFEKEIAAHITEYFAVRVGESVDIRLSVEMTVESLMSWLTAMGESVHIGIFLERFLVVQNRVRAIRAILDVVMNLETTQKGQSDATFCTGISLICEMGLAIREIGEMYPDLIKDPDKLLSHISAYLLSVSNHSSNHVRLSLLNYFGVVESGLARNNFHKILDRFGHSMLDFLLRSLFEKKTEAVALRYLQENFGFILDADYTIQKTVFETLKFYMLKKPERFVLFCKEISKRCETESWDAGQKAISVWMRHLALLFGVTSDVNHVKLGSEMFLVLRMHKARPGYDELIDQVYRDPKTRKQFKEFIDFYERPKPKQRSSINLIRGTKRGRKPSLSKAPEMTTVDQVAFLNAV
jgi:hypothetical protein